MNIFEKLTAIQVELKAPKGNYNSFGKYNYRSCEDSLESLKPLLAKHKATLKITDYIEQIGDRYYIGAVVEFFDMEKPDVAPITGRAYAREVETKTGMDGSQITGTASSYARKYALNGLFLIDDTKDADTDEYANQTSGKSSAKDAKAKASNKKEQADTVDFNDLINEGQVATIEMLLNKAQISVEKFCSINKVSVINDIKSSEYDGIVSKLEVAVKAKEGK